MKSVVLIIFFHLSFLSCFCQQTNSKTPGNFVISGNVVDSFSKQSLEAATISLTDAATKKYINGILSGSNGYFRLKDVKAGSYIVSIGLVGYKELKKEIIIRDSTSKEITIPDLLLVKSAVNLQGVTVSASKQIIENKLDKIVFNVDKDITSQGGMATDALKKIPQVTVDVNGNVELLGNPSVRFLINGKPSGIFGNNPAEALQSIPASQIQSIEVITSPSAKYDASGTGGIINIILKKSKVEGFNGNINLSTGTRLENAGVNASLKKNNFSISIYFGGNLQLVSNTPVTMNRLSVKNSSGSAGFMQQSATDFGRNGYKSGIGVDWKISKKDNITASFDFNHFANRNKGDYDQVSVQYDVIGNELSNISSIRSADTKIYVNTIDGGVSYTRKFKKDKQELEIFYTGSYANNNTFYDQAQHYKTTDTLFSGSRSLNPGKENQTELGMNYSHPLGENTLFETGIKTAIESIISNADVFTLNTASGTYKQDQGQSLRSDFRRNVYSVYASLSFPAFKILDIKAGLRYEHTENNAAYSNVANTVIPAYNNIAPSLIIARSFNNKQSIKFTYAYRLERPDFRDLNPFINLSDPHNITTGNPGLQPEIGHNYSFTYIQTFKGGGNINVVLYLQKNSPDIKPYIRYYPVYKIGDSLYSDVTLTTRATIAEEIRSGVNISVSVPVNKKLTIRSNVQLFNRHLNNPYDTPAVTNGIGTRTNMNISYLFSKSVAAELFGNYNSGMKWQGKQPSAFSYTLAVRKEFKNNKGSLGFVAVNPFNRYIDQKTMQVTNTFTSNMLRQLPYRSFGISFNYKFGKLKFTKPKESDNYLFSPPVENQ